MAWEVSPEDPESYSVYAVFPKLEVPECYVSRVGCEVFETLPAAWTELTSPAWGDRAIYYNIVPSKIVRAGGRKNTGPDRAYMLREEVVGWELLTPDDLTILRMETAFLGHTFTELAVQDSQSWFIQMANRISELRIKQVNPTTTIGVDSIAPTTKDQDPTGALQYALTILPRRISVIIEEQIIRKLQTALHARAGEIKYLKERLEVEQGENRALIDKLRSLEAKVRDLEEYAKWSSSGGFHPSAPVATPHPPFSGTLEDAKNRLRDAIEDEMKKQTRKLGNF